MSRGTRPKGPAPWPKVAEGQRQGAYDAAALIGQEAEETVKKLRGIIARAEAVKDRPQANIYLTERYLREIHAAASDLLLKQSQIGLHSEYARRLLSEARAGDVPDPAMTDHEIRIAQLEAELAELRALVEGRTITRFPGRAAGE